MLKAKLNGRMDAINLSHSLDGNADVHVTAATYRACWRNKYIDMQRNLKTFKQAVQHLVTLAYIAKMVQGTKRLDKKLTACIGTSVEWTSPGKGNLGVAKTLKQNKLLTTPRRRTNHLHKNCWTAWHNIKQRTELWKYVWSAHVWSLNKPSAVINM